MLQTFKTFYLPILIALLIALMFIFPLQSIIFGIFLIIAIYYMEKSINLQKFKTYLDSNIKIEILSRLILYIPILSSAYFLYLIFDAIDQVSFTFIINVFCFNVLILISQIFYIIFSKDNK